MNIERRIQAVSGLENRPEFWIVEILVIRMRIDDESIQFETVDSPIHFFRCSLRRLRRETGETRKSSRMPLDSFSEHIICNFREIRSRIRVKHLDAGRG